MEHSHSNCSGHSHTNNENITIKKPLNDKKIYQFLYVVGFISLVIGGTILQTCLFSSYIEFEREQVSYDYSAWFILSMILTSYYKTATTDPSQTFIEAKVQENPKRFFYISTKNFKNICEFCNKRVKFERSSHCSTCNACITRRDHHCNWIAKCVGYTNTQYFINLIFWLVIGGIHYVSGFIIFYNSEYEKKEQDQVSTILKIFSYIYTFIMFSGTLAASGLLITQINCIYNEASFYEKSKNHHLETYYLCCVPKSLEQNQSLGYNKGFVNNFYNLIGPSIFHFCFPLYKYSKQDIPENEIAFAKIKNPHAFAVRKFLLKNKNESTQKIQDQEKKDEEPLNFLELSKTKYQNYKII